MKNDLVYVTHVLETMAVIESFLNIPQAKDRFFSERLLQDGCIRNLQVLSKSLNRLSQESKNKFPEIPWPQISGFRNLVVHNYFGIDLNIVWSVIEEDLPSLKKNMLVLQSTLPPL